MRLAISLTVLGLLMLAGMTVGGHWSAPEVSWPEAIGITVLSAAITGLIVGAVFVALWAGGAV